MEICIGIVSITTLALIWLLQYLFYKLSNPNNIVKLPPGNLGLPILGETIQFFKSSKTLDDAPFFKERIKRYGPIFKTRLCGMSLVISTDPEFNYFLHQEEGRLCQSWFPDTISGVFGSYNIVTMHDKNKFKYLKSMVLRVFGPETQKEVLVHEVQKVAQDALASWEKLPSIELLDKISTMIFNITTKKLISVEDPRLLDDLKKNFGIFMKKLLSFPVDIPGMSYHKCLQGRDNVMKVLKSILRERLSSPRSKSVDLFDHLVEELRKDKPIVDETFVLNMTFLLLFAAFETSSLSLTLGIKLLADHPRVIEELAEEHESLIKKRHNPDDDAVSWNEYKSMTFTLQVVNEVLRLANVAPGTFRKTLADIHIKDYTVPKGWVIFVWIQSTHLNPHIYEDPLSFNPYRWKNPSPEKCNGKSHFMPFGGGFRLCIGADFAKLMATIFLHCLVTKYRWEVIKEGKLIRSPNLQHPEGYIIKLSKKNT